MRQTVRSVETQPEQYPVIRRRIRRASSYAFHTDFIIVSMRTALLLLLACTGVEARACGNRGYDS